MHTLGGEREASKQQTNKRKKKRKKSKGGGGLNCGVGANVQPTSIVYRVLYDQTVTMWYMDELNCVPGTL